MAKSNTPFAWFVGAWVRWRVAGERLLWQCFSCNMLKLKKIIRHQLVLVHSNGIKYIFFLLAFSVWSSEIGCFSTTHALQSTLVISFHLISAPYVLRFFFFPITFCCCSDFIPLSHSTNNKIRKRFEHLMSHTNEASAGKCESTRREKTKRIQQCKGNSKRAERMKSSGMDGERGKYHLVQRKKKKTSKTKHSNLT